MTTKVNNNVVRPRRILLVDDDADIISTFKIILEMNGFEVDAYTSPLSALSNFKPNDRSRAKNPLNSSSMQFLNFGHNYPYFHI